MQPRQQQALAEGFTHPVRRLQAHAPQVLGVGRRLWRIERGLAQLLPLLKQQCAVRRLVLDEGRRLGARLPATALIDQFYADLQARGDGRLDTSSLIRRLR